MDARQAELIKSLFRMAWADGDASDDEIAILSSLCERAGLSLGERLAVMDAGLSDDQHEKDKLEQVLPDHQSRLDAMEMLLAVSFSDGKLDEKEVDYLGDLARRLGIGPEDLERLRRRVQR